MTSKNKMAISETQFKKEVSKRGLVTIPKKTYKDVSYIINKIIDQGLEPELKKRQLILISKNDGRRIKKLLSRTEKELQYELMFSNLTGRTPRWFKGLESQKEAIKSEILKLMPDLFISPKEKIVDIFSHLQPQYEIKDGLAPKIIITPKKPVKELDVFLNMINPNIIKFQREQLAKSKHGSIKFGMCIGFQYSIEMKKVNGYKEVWIQSPLDIYADSQLGISEDTKTFYETKIDKFSAPEGSGMVIKGFTLSKCYSVTKGFGKKRGRIFDVPDYIKKSKFIINPKWRTDTIKGRKMNEEDNDCLKHAVTVAMFYEEVNHGLRDKLEQYVDFEKKLNFEGIKVPSDRKDVDMIEKNNNIAINVFTFTMTEFIPYNISKRKDRMEVKNIDLLALDDEDEGHYLPITDLCSLLNRQSTGTNQRHQLCRLCYGVFDHNKNMASHYEMCKTCNDGTTTLILPNGDNDKIRFNKVKAKLMKPIYIVADFEALIVENVHIPFAIGIKVVTTKPFDNLLNFPIKIIFAIDEQDNIVEKLYDYITKEVEPKIKNLIKNAPFKKCPKLSYREQELYDDAEDCHICKGEFIENDKNYMKVRDHCHYTGVYRGAAHSICNLQFNYYKYDLPIIFHNLRNYDGHFIVKGLKNIIKQRIANKQTKSVGCIATTIEKYLTFNLGNMKFMDSYCFLQSSLDSAVESLKDSGLDKFKYIHELGVKDPTYLFAKGTMPYEWLDSFDKLNESKLPPIECYQSKLTGEGLNEESYKVELKAWDVFECNSMKDYIEQYLKRDVLLLADVFDNFRNMCYDNMKLDILYYLGLPGYSWDAMLKMTGIELGLITEDNIDLFNLIESNIRGGQSFSMLRYAKHVEGEVNNHYILGLDQKNLYGWCMSQNLPIGNFKEEFGLTKDDLLKINPDDELGYLLYFDEITFSEDIHDYFNDYPPVSEKMIIPDEWRSEYQREIRKKSSNSEKLVNTLTPKKNYLHHIKLFQLNSKLGVKYGKLLRVWSYKQGKWLKPYIDFNTEKRAVCKKNKDEFGTDLYKKLNNVIYGKCIESLRKRRDIKLCYGEEQFNYQVNDPKFKHPHEFDDDFYGIELMKSQIVYDKPISVGFVILELSKFRMVDAWYNKIMKHCVNPRLLGTDTDSFYFTADGKKEDYIKFLTGSNIGELQDEYEDWIINEAIFLASKVYALRMTAIKDIYDKKGNLLYKAGDTKDKKIGKGIKKTVKETTDKATSEKKTLDFDLYKEQLFNKEENNEIKYWILQSRKHTITTHEIVKKGISSYNDKAYLYDPIQQLSYGNYRIKDI